MVKKSKRIEMPHPGHLICAYQCSFRRCTYVNGFIVSTIGEYIPRYSDADQGSEKNWEQIGCDRLYETEVFRAKKSKHKCCPYVIRVQHQMDFAPYNKADDANAGHEAMVKKWSTKRLRGK